MLNHWREKLEEVNDELIAFIKEEVAEKDGSLELVSFEDANNRANQFYELPRTNAEDRRGDLEEYAIVKISLYGQELKFNLLSITGETEDEEKQVMLSSLDVNNLVDITDYLEYLKSN